MPLAQQPANWLIQKVDMMTNNCTFHKGDVIASNFPQSFGLLLKSFEQWTVSYV
jgi:hypothetical protein